LADRREYPVSVCMIGKKELNMGFETGSRHGGAAGYPYDASRGKAAQTGASQELEHMSY